MVGRKSVRALMADGAVGSAKIVSDPDCQLIS
jgi:hypothetical protein